VLKADATTELPTIKRRYKGSCVLAVSTTWLSSFSDNLPFVVVLSKE
jgi:hypothetical protein